MPGIDLTAVTAYIETNLLLDTVRVQAPSGTEPVFDPDTGRYSDPELTTVYEGPGAIQKVGTTISVHSIDTRNLPWAEESSSRYILLTPKDAPVPAAHQLVTMVAVHDGGDSALLGRRWRTQDPGQAGTLNPVRITPLDQEADRTT